MRLGLKLLTTLMLFMAWSCSAAPDAGDDAPYPVWWSPELALDSLDDIDDRMGIEFSRDHWKVVVRYRDRQKAVIDNCISLTTLRKTHDSWFGDAKSSANEYFGSLQVDCEVLSMLRGAASANQSYLRSFVLSPKALDFLPALTIDHESALPGPRGPCEIVCELLVANAKGIPWSHYEDVPMIEVRGEEHMVVWAKGRGVRLKIFARGDFDGDGIDDILIKRHFLSPRRIWPRSDLMLLTRYIPGGVLRVLNPPSSCIYSDGTSACPQIE